MISSSVEKSSDTDDLSNDPLKVLWYGGYHPSKNSRWNRLLALVNFLIICFFLTLAIKGFADSYKTDIFFTAECLQTCFLMTHAMGKLLVLQFRKNTLYSMLQKKSKFWKIESFDGIVYEECSSIFKTSKKIIRVYCCLVACAALLFDMQPFSTGYLPTSMYLPEGWFNYLTVVLWYLSCFVLLAFIGNDGFFCSLSISLVIQFKLLAHKFQTFSLKRDELLLSELKELVYYHNFLLGYCKELEKAFSEVFLIQFLEAIASASLSVFIFSQPGDWTNRTKFGTYFLLLIFQSAFYCVPSELLTNTAFQVGDALYNSTWYEVRRIKLKKSFISILARTQKAVIFSGRGLIYINLKTFLQICKTVFTFYTYLNSAKKLSDKA